MDGVAGDRGVVLPPEFVNGLPLPEEALAALTDAQRGERRSGAEGRRAVGCKGTLLPEEALAALADAQRGVDRAKRGGKRSRPRVGVAA